MATPLVAQYGREVGTWLGAQLRAVDAAFPAAAVEAALGDDYDTLPLMARGHRLAAALSQTLPTDPEAAAALVLASLGPPLPDAHSFGMAAFRYLPHTLWAGYELGREHPALALTVLKAVTRRFTSEFGVRPLLQQHPELTWATLTAWVHDDCFHVRRWVSEGPRPRLPWAKHLPPQPDRALPLLTVLRDDPSPYVRRSVANHLNDLSYSDPDGIAALMATWSHEAPATRSAVIRRATRTLRRRAAMP